MRMFCCNKTGNCVYCVRISAVALQNVNLSMKMLILFTGRYKVIKALVYGM